MIINNLTDVPKFAGIYQTQQLVTAPGKRSDLVDRKRANLHNQQQIITASVLHIVTEIKENGFIYNYSFSISNIS